MSDAAPQENLEVNHLNLSDTEDRRKLGKDKCRITLTEIRENTVEVELLCCECHKKWSMAQRRAAYQLLASLSVEEQIKLIEASL